MLRAFLHVPCCVSMFCDWTSSAEGRPKMNNEEGLVGGLYGVEHEAKR